MPFYGNQYTGSMKSYSHEQLVDAARELGEELGRSPTTREAEADDRFPSLGTIYTYAEGGWGGVLEDAGLERTQVREYGTEEEPQMCEDLTDVFERVDTQYLTHRQYDELGAYPTSVVKEQFGSWKAACDAVGLPAGQKHGTVCDGPKGERLESDLERRVAVALYEREIEYVAHPAIGDTNWEADFYLPELELWVEVDGYVGGTRPNKRGFASKVASFRERGESLVVVETVEELLTKIDDRLTGDRASTSE
jgi:hypothetical protein